MIVKLVIQDSKFKSKKIKMMIVALQPTIVDPVAFDDWRPEAFGLWVEQWGKVAIHKNDLS